VIAAWASGPSGRWIVDQAAGSEGHSEFEGLIGCLSRQLR
jgi:hypothetical protein